MLLPTAAPLAAANWRVDAEQSTFAVLTHRAGPAARLAHDHLIVARAPEVELDFDPADPSTARARFVEPVLALDVDPPTERAALGPRLVALGLLGEPFPELDGKEREKVRRSMLSAPQLFAERFPEIRAELASVRRSDPPPDAAPGGASTQWQGTLELELRGARAERVIPITWHLDGGTLRAELVATFRFTELGIEPYSAFLGAVRNDDPFQVVVELVATASNEAAEGSAP